jgi:hypothetical protein
MNQHMRDPELAKMSAPVRAQELQRRRHEVEELGRARRRSPRALNVMRAICFALVAECGGARQRRCAGAMKEATCLFDRGEVRRIAVNIAKLPDLHLLPRQVIEARDRLEVGADFNRSLDFDLGAFFR